MTGLSRSILRGDLAWLVETGAAEHTLDADKRKLWRAVPEDVDQDQQPVLASAVDLTDPTDYGALEELLSSFG